jgi:S1-C subfamily serine protease
LIQPGPWGRQILGLLLALIAWPAMAGHPDVRSGTGFFVSASGQLLTSAHVVSGCREVTVWPSNARGMPALVSTIDQNLDVALLSIEPQELALARTIATGLHWPRVGEMTYSVAFGVERTTPREPHFASGVIMSMSAGSPDRPLMVIDTRLERGSSGAPVIDADGMLLGIVVGRFSLAPDHAVAIPAAMLTRFLSGWRVGDPPSELQRPDPNTLLATMSVLVQCASATPREEVKARSP